MEKYGKVWKSVGKCRNMCISVKKYKSVEKCGKVWNTLEKCGQV